MKRLILSTFFSLMTLALFAQCDDLFISEYVEGYGNNRALELYNPTANAIDLSQYSVGRFSNGSTSYVGIGFPVGEMIQPYETYVAVLDKRDSTASGLETPVWNGYQLWDYCTDQLTGDTLTYTDTGDTIFCVQYDTTTGLHLYGTEYHDWLDLQGKADIFLCPVYDVNNAMYFNGNDAVALVKGLTVAGDGSNILDVIGVIGDPSMANELSWVDSLGGWITRDKTLERKPDIQKGTGPVADALGDEFDYGQWNVWGKNNFYGVGAHECTCDPDFMSAVDDLNQIAFKMYPNPVMDWMIIETAEQIERVEVYNIMGQQVISERVEDKEGLVNLNTQMLDSGVYVISLFFENNRQSVNKFIKR